MMLTTVNPTTVRALARYLSLHPMASDTAPGIARWWLHDPEDVSELGVLLALEWLESQQLLERAAAPDGRVCFRRAAATEGDPWRERLRKALRTLPPVR
jgi:hypothetical protein